MRLPAEVIHRSQGDFFPLYIMFAELNLQNKYIFLTINSWDKKKKNSVIFIVLAEFATSHADVVD